MFTPEQYQADSMQFLSQFVKLKEETEQSLLALLQEKKIWERYGDRPWMIYNRRRPSARVDMKRLLKLQEKGWLFKLDDSVK